MTQYRFKVFLVIPAARRPAARNWVNTHVDPGRQSQWFLRGINVTGSGAATHFASCFHLRLNKLAALVNLLAGIINETPPADLAEQTAAQQWSWLRGFANRLWTGAQIGLSVELNEDGDRPDVFAALLTVGLRFINPAV